MMNRMVLSLVLASTFGLAACDSGGSSAAANPGFAELGEGCASTADCIGALVCVGPALLCAEPPAAPGFAELGEGCAATADCIGELVCLEAIVDEGWLCEEPAADPVVDPVNNPIHENCAFKQDLQGTSVGDHIKNFSLKTVDNEEYNLHSQNCGQPQKAALYVILGTGWCGACEAYAPRGEALYQAYKDAGLEILWIESENEKAEPVTLEWLSNWRDEKGTTFPLTRDLSFAHTYGAMAHASTSLPHLYILDPVTMTLVYAAGGGSKWDEAEGIVADLLGVDMPLYNQ